MRIAEIGKQTNNIFSLEGLWELHHPPRSDPICQCTGNIRAFGFDIRDQSLDHALIQPRLH